MLSRLPRIAHVFARFLIVGGVGFTIDGAVVTLLMLVSGWNALPARASSMLLAITATWLLNRRVTFARRAIPGHLEYAGYVAIQVTGGALNIVIFMLCLKIWPELERWPIVAQAAGSATALFFNFTLAHKALYATRELPR